MVFVTKIHENVRDIEKYPILNRALFTVRSTVMKVLNIYGAWPHSEIVDEILINLTSPIHHLKLTENS